MTDGNATHSLDPIQTVRALKSWLKQRRNSSTATPTHSPISSPQHHLTGTHAPPKGEGDRIYRGLILCAQNPQSPLVQNATTLAAIVGGKASTIVLLPLGETKLSPLLPNTIIISRPLKQKALYHALLQAVQLQTPAPNTAMITQPVVTSSLSLLLADDNVVNQKVALHLLGKLGYRSDVANNGLEVLQALRLRSYDVIFMDLHMPEMDGLTASQNILQTYPNPPRIVVLSAGDFDSELQGFRVLGIQHFLPKPFRREDLKQLLTSLERECAARFKHREHREEP